MMTVGNIQYAPQECNGGKKIVSIYRMPAHLRPLLLGKLALLLQDVIWNTHFANIVEQYATVNVYHFRVVDANVSRQPHSRLCDAPCMTLCFSVAKFQRACPAFQCRVIRLDQFLIRAL